MSWNEIAGLILLLVVLLVAYGGGYWAGRRDGYWQRTKEEKGMK